MLLCVAPVAVQAQSCEWSISGKVIDEHDQSALSYSNIILLETNQYAVADSNGYFIIRQVCSGKYTLIVEHIGCTPDTVTLDVNSSITRNFYLEHHEEELAGIITTAVKYTSGLSSHEVDSKELEKLEGKNLGQILNGIAGVNQLKTGANISKPIIHGLYGDRILLVENGVRLESQNWGTEHAPEIDPLAAQSISVIKGAATLEYGTESLGGMVVIQPPVLKKQPHLNVDISLVGQTNGKGITTAAKIQQGFKKQAAYYLQGTFKKLGDQQAPDYNLSNTGLQETNLSAGFGWMKRGWDLSGHYALYSQKAGIFRSAHIGNLTDLNNAIQSDTPLIVLPFTYDIIAPKQHNTHHLAKVQLRKYFSKQRTLHIAYSAQHNRRQEYDIRRGGRSDIASLDMRLFTNNVLTTFQRTHSIGKKSHLLEGKSGIHFTAKQNRNDAATGVKPLIPDYYQYGIGFFDMEQLKLRSFTLDWGARYDYTRMLAYVFDNNNRLQTPTYNFHTYAISLGGSWTSRQQEVQLQSGIAVNSRFPNASELFSNGLHHGIAAIEFGEPDLHPEKGIKWTTTLLAQYKKFIQAEVTAYISTIYDFIYLAPLPEPILTIRGAFPAFRYYQTDAQLAGLDMTLKSTPAKWLSLYGRYSMLRGKNKSTDEYLIYMPADNIAVGFEWQQDFSAVKNVFFGMEYKYTFEQKKLPISIPDFKAAPGDYHLLGASAGFTYPVNDKNSISFSVSGENITNSRYREYLNRFRYYADETAWNLTFRIKYSFQ